MPGGRDELARDCEDHINVISTAFEHFAHRLPFDHLLKDVTTLLGDDIRADYGAAAR